MTDEALALAFRSGLPFVGLRDHTPDPDLDRIVPLEVARTARALPLAAKDDHIRLAVAHPDPDLSALNPYLAGREIDLALAPREELDAILGPPPPVAEPEQAEAEAPEQLAGEADEHAPLAAEPEPHTAEPTAPPDTTEPEPLTAAASEEVPAPLAADAEPATARGNDEEPEPSGEEPGSDPGGGLGPGQAAVVAAEPTAPVDDHPELAGEVPSWLEPPRRRGRVVVTVLVVIVILAVAAAILIAVANA